MPEYSSLDSYLWSPESAAYLYMYLWLLEFPLRSCVQLQKVCLYILLSLFPWSPCSICLVFWLLFVDGTFFSVLISNLFLMILIVLSKLFFASFHLLTFSFLFFLCWPDPEQIFITLLNSNGICGIFLFLKLLASSP